MIDLNQGHYFSGSKARLIRIEVMIYLYGSNDLSGSGHFSPDLRLD
jgi:hypothetical protein